MRVFICEKPDQAAKLASALKINNRRHGYFDGTTTQVTWAIGHLLELYAPDDYDPAWKQWSLSNLPVIPQRWRSKVMPSRRKQFETIRTLLKGASEVVLACDYDREGEAIACSIVDFCGYKGTRKRLKLRALDPTSIRRALDDMVDASETRPLYYAAIARQRADWLVGMNLTRLYTALVREAGGRSVMNVGRVLTPTVKLVCDRDTRIANFKPYPFYVVTASFQVAAGSFQVTWMPGEDCRTDEDNRCLDLATAQAIAQKVQGKSGVIDEAETKRGTESAPLPYDLAALQKHAASAWGLSSAETLEIAQSLYDKTLISYPRTDCRYLPKAQLEDAPDIIKHLSAGDQAFGGLCAAADLSKAPRSFNDNKVTAHHGIIPTLEPADLSALSENEWRIYDVVRRLYLAQFYPAAEFSRTKVTLSCEGEHFVARGRVPLKPGWKMVMDEPPSEDEEPSSESESPSSQLPPIHTGERCRNETTDLDTKHTRPPPHFTESTLLGALENIARFVDDPEAKRVLKEHSGIGTPATRSGIIQGAVDRELLARDKKNLVATKKAHSLVALIAPMLTSPVMTAQWEQSFEEIVEGNAGPGETVQRIEQWIANLVERICGSSDVIVEGIQNDPVVAAYLTASAPREPEKHPCPTCGGEARRFRRRKKGGGYFWKCQEVACGEFFDDVAKKPQPRLKQPEECPKCPECGADMVLRRASKGKSKGRRFWACSNYKESGCKVTIAYSE